jgi:metallophosphoesterase superfamily enzyme
LPEIVGGTVARAFEISGITFQHDPVQETGQRSPRIVFGHFHPAALVSLAGRLVRRRCFVIGSRRLLIPAFGSYAGGLNILSPVILDQFPGGYKVLLLERNRLYNIQIQHLRPDSNLALSRKLSD